MGKILSVLKGEEQEEKAKQDLEILQKLVDAKLNQFQSELNEHFLNPDSSSKTQVPGIRALRWEKRAHANIEQRPDDCVEKAVDDFFDAGSKNNPDAVKKGFKEVVKTALNVFLGNTEAGEISEDKFFVYMLHNTIVRVDVKLWRWNLSGHSLSATHKSVLGYIMCISAVDPLKLHTAEFVYLISEYAGDEEDNVEKYIDAMSNMYARARKMNDPQQVSSQPGKLRLK